MEGLSVNEAALILCILGALRNGERFYLSVEESLRYMKTGTWSSVKKEEVESSVRQLSLFSY